MDIEIQDSLRERFNALFSGSTAGLSKALGIEFVSIHEHLVVATMPVSDQTRQPHGILHGGASVALAETVASVGGNVLLKDPKAYVVGLEINANHLKSVSSGKVVAKGKPIHLGRRTQVWAIEIVQGDALVCSSRCTLMVQCSAD